jgi:cytoplasmic tRNA 2-thiolation protein 2
VVAKCTKQMSILGKELGPIRVQGERILLGGLSLGTSSAAMVAMLHTYVTHIIDRGRRAPFNAMFVHVDVDGSAFEESGAGAQALRKFKERFPSFSFRSVPLATALGLSSIDWSTLPAINRTQTSEDQLNSLFASLSSATSRADVVRLFIRHILASIAVGESCQAILFGHSTTALAELTLSETAKGRGFSLPWQTNDGPLAVSYFKNAVEGKTQTDLTSPEPTNGTPGDGKRSMGTNIQVHHPLRDLLRKELVTYTKLVSPPLAEMIPEGPDLTGSVVSHKDISIEEVMIRYFAEVEENYPSVVANVAKTTAKLDRLEVARRCGLCSMPLDELGDERWRGEIGDDWGGAGDGKGDVCYGCERLVHG